MLPVRSGVQVWLATGYTDMRKGFPGIVGAKCAQKLPQRVDQWPNTYDVHDAGQIVSQHGERHLGFYVPQSLQMNDFSAFASLRYIKPWH